jgi:hypothetical protein
MTRYFYGASHEEFPPEALLRHTVIVLQNNPAANVERAIDVLGGQVLPALRGARV